MKVAARPYSTSPPNPLSVASSFGIALAAIGEG